MDKLQHLATADRSVDGEFDLTLPPQCIEAEEAILGGILIDPGAMDRVADKLTPDMFYVDAHKEIFKAQKQLYDAENPTDIMAVATLLSDQGKLEKIGGQSKIVRLCDLTVSAVNIDYQANLLKDRYVRRRLSQAAIETYRLSHNMTLELDGLLNAAEEKMLAVSQTQVRSSMQSVSSSVQEAFQTLCEKYDASTNGLMVGTPTGFYDLDAMTQGLQKGDLIIIAARPSMGKTSLGLDIAQNIARQKQVLIFSLEMSREQLTFRLISSVACVSGNKIKSGNLNDQDWAQVSAAIGIVGELKIDIDDDPSPTLAQIRAGAQRKKAEYGEIGLIVIDYLQMMEGSSDNRVQELSKITRSLKGLARKIDCPVIALSQLSRACEGRTNKRPMLSDLRESGSIEQDADLVINLYRDEYYNPETPDIGVAEAIIAKHRNGPVGTVKLLFEPRYASFKNLLPQSQHSLG
jgi:replicative DNA helicase